VEEDKILLTVLEPTASWGLFCREIADSVTGVACRGLSTSSLDRLS
jgi:hypothetical protein